MSFHKRLVPICNHGAPKHMLETGYEYFEGLCDECFETNNALIRQRELDALKVKWNTGGIVLAEECEGRVILYAPKSAHRGNPEKGIWFEASLTRDEFDMVSK